MITLTPTINHLTKNLTCKERQKVLKAAWDACCDGEVIGDYLEVYGIDTKCDLWDGHNEALREGIELDIVAEIMYDEHRDLIPSDCSVFGSRNSNPNS